MAPGLCFRILEHLEQLGLLKPGDTVLDSLAGTGMTGLVAAVKGYPSILVELEERFCGFIKANREALEKKLGHEVDMTIIRGDSRHLSELLAERGLVQVVSPPYADSEGRDMSKEQELREEYLVALAKHKLVMAECEKATELRDRLWKAQEVASHNLLEAQRKLLNEIAK